MRMIRTQVAEFEGYAVTVTVDGLEKYKDTFLKICNNVRESRELFKVDNYAWNNDITVYCEIDSKDALVDFLEWFGPIKKCEKVLFYQVGNLPDCDWDKYSEQVIIPYSE